MIDEIECGEIARKQGEDTDKLLTFIRVIDEIERIYGEIARKREQGEDTDKLLTFIRKLQEIEAERIQTEFEASLELPMGEATKVLYEARELIKKYEV